MTCNGDEADTTIAKGYDDSISYSLNRESNWWVTLSRHSEGRYILDVQVGNHHTVILDADRDGCRGVDEDRLEVAPRGRYRVALLSKALGLVAEHETRIVYAMEALFRASNNSPDNH